MVKCRNEEIRIMFTSVGRRVELVQSFRQAAELLGKKLVIYGADLTTSAPALYYCDRNVQVCRISEEAYIPSLLDVCREEKIDLLIPTIDTDLLKLAQNKGSFHEIGTKVFISSVEMVSYCRDKRCTAELFEKCGLLAPKSYGNVDDYKLGYPAFIKPLDGSSSIDAYKVNTEEELHEYANRINGYVIQPFVDGVEYTIDIMCDMEGNPIYITPRERVAVRSGEVLKTKIVQDEKMIEEAKRLISVFKPCGPITVQLIRNFDNEDYFIEINPRFGGGAPLSMKAGADAAVATLQLLSGKEVCFVEAAARDGVVYSRFDQCIYVNEQECYESENVTNLIEEFMKYKAIILDLDDTLYSEKEYVRSGYRKVTEQIAELHDAYEMLWQGFVDGKSVFDYVLSEKGIYSDKLKQECLEIYREQTPDIHLYEGVRDMLLALRAKGKKLGIITDGRVNGQKRKLEQLGLYDLVDEVIITDELAGNGEVSCFRKPNTIAFEIMKKRLNVRFEDMIYVGDNQAKDFQAPRKLGMAYAYINNVDGIYRKQ